MHTNHGQSASTDQLLPAVERLQRLSTLFSRAFQQQLGLTVYQVATLAAVQQGARHLHQVADATGQQVSGASRLVDKLVGDGLLERQPDAVDRRAISLNLTPAGQALLDDARGVAGALVNEALQLMPAELAGQLVPVLGAFSDATEELLAARSVASD